MIFVFFLLWFAIGIGATVYLALNGQPWIALAVLIVTASLRFHSDDDDCKEKTDDTEGDL